MTKPLIFVSCGQRTQSEKNLGTQICSLIRENTEFDVFFAERQHSLRGLHENILGALAKAQGFVTVLHARGSLDYESPFVRASVWIEQEIAIAAYIQMTSQRDLKIAAYSERSVGREGLRELLHLNPYIFDTNDEVLQHLQEQLVHWRDITPSQPEMAIELLKNRSVYGFDLQVRLVNNGPRADTYSCSIEVPASILRERSVWGELPSARPGYRRFTFTERGAVDDMSGRHQGPMVTGAAKEFFSLAVSINEIPENKRSMLLLTPILVVGQIGNQTEKKQVSLADIFGLGELNY